MLRIIQFFSERRPEILLMFSKCFLIMNTESSEEGSRVCGPALAKYVIEKWKNVLDVI
jgi:hypothetical protein